MFRVLGQQPDLGLTVESPEPGAARYRDQCFRCAGCRRNRDWRKGRQRRCWKAKNALTLWSATRRLTATPRKPSKISASSRRAVSAFPSRNSLVPRLVERRLGNLSRSKFTLCRHQIQRARAGSGKHGRRGHWRKCSSQVKLPERLSASTGRGNTKARSAREHRLLFVLPITHPDYLCDSLQHVPIRRSGPLLTLANVSLAPIGGHSRASGNRRASAFQSGVGFLAICSACPLMQTGVIMVEYINHLRAAGYSIEDAVGAGSNAAVCARL